MSKIKIEPLELFTGKNDVRKFLTIEMNDEGWEYFEKEHDVSPEILEEILATASIYVDMINVNKPIELEVAE